MERHRTVLGHHNFAVRLLPLGLLDDLTLGFAALGLGNLGHEDVAALDLGLLGVAVVGKFVVPVVESVHGLVGEPHRALVLVVCQLARHLVHWKCTGYRDTGRRTERIEVWFRDLRPVEEGRIRLAVDLDCNLVLTLGDLDLGGRHLVARQRGQQCDSKQLVHIRQLITPGPTTASKLW